MQVNLSSNRLCGVWEEYDGFRHRLKGTYSAEGIKAVADALRVNGSLTALDVRDNKLDDEAKTLLRDAVKDKSGFKLDV